MDKKTSSIIPASHTAARDCKAIGIWCSESGRCQRFGEHKEGRAGQEGWVGGICHPGVVAVKTTSACIMPRFPQTRHCISWLLAMRIRRSEVGCCRQFRKTRGAIPDFLVVIASSTRITCFPQTWYSGRCCLEPCLRWGCYGNFFESFGYM